MRNRINIGDFIDLFARIKHRGAAWMLGKFQLRKRDRIQNTWEHIVHDSNWWMIPTIKKRWNQLIGGDAERHYSGYVVERYFQEKKGLRMLSPGCGTGTPELLFADFDCFGRIDAFDIAPSLIAEAQAEAKKAGKNQLHFFIGDIYNYDGENESYDVILFHSSLHHFERLDDILKNMKRLLVPGGLLIINEYVGPSRMQFSASRLAAINEALKQLPPNYRQKLGGGIKNRVYAPGYWRMLLSDPSEAVCSDEIPARLAAMFEVMEEKGQGGNILHLLLKDIAHNFLDESKETKKWLQLLFDFEDMEMKREGKSDFLFGVYQK